MSNNNDELYVILQTYYCNTIKKSEMKRTITLMHFSLYIFICWNLTSAYFIDNSVTRKPISYSYYASTISETVNAIYEKRTTVLEEVKYSLYQIKEKDKQIFGFVKVDGDAAIKCAIDLDNRLDNINSTYMPLLGVPIAIKDNICVSNMQTTASSFILEGYVPKHEATAVRLLKQAGAIVVGKTNTDEFGMGDSTMNSAYQVTRNPWNGDYSPGGSSGGSAAVVASKQVLCALGSDTGGSIRQPSAFCGVVGMKPTYGRVSRYGLIPYASSTDCIGPIASCVMDCALLMDVMTGWDKLDSTSLSDGIKKGRIFQQACTLPAAKNLKNLRVGVLDLQNIGHVVPQVQKCIDRAASDLSDLGASVESMTISNDLLEDCVSAYYSVAITEAASNLARFDGLRFGKRCEITSDRNTNSFEYEAVNHLCKAVENHRNLYFGSEAKRRISMGLKGKIKLSYSHNKFDVILSPVSASPTPRLTDCFDGGNSPIDDLCVVIPSITGLPAISLPYGNLESIKNMPVGIQLCGASCSEELLFKVASALEWKRNSNQ